jgi:hypothetical protein
MIPAGWSRSVTTTVAHRWSGSLANSTLFIPPAMKKVLPFCTKSKATHAPPFSYLLMKKRISLDGMVIGIQSK